MLLPSRAALVLLTCLLAGLTGCQTGEGRDARIRAQAAVFDQLDGRSQALIRQGLVEAGFTDTMVRMALGEPSSTSTRATPAGPMTIWVYRNFVYDVQSAVHWSGNAPGARPAGAVNSSSSPDGGSLSSTKGNGMRSSVGEAGDAPVGRLTLGLIDGKVTDMRLEP